MVSTNSTKLAEEAKNAFATAIDSVSRMIEQDDEMVGKLRNQSTELLVMAIEAVRPLIRYVDVPLTFLGPLVNGGGVRVTNVDYSRAALVCSNFEFGYGGVGVCLLRNGMFLMIKANRCPRVLHLADVLHNLRKTEEHVDLVMTLIEGLAQLFADAIAKSDARRASMQDRATRLTAAAAAFKTPTATST